jgi:type I restriction enzyme S subunit
MSWEFTTIGEYFVKTKGLIQTGPFGSSLHQSDYREKGFPVIMPKDITNDRVSVDSIARIGVEDKSRLSKHIVLEGDIVYPRRGEITKRAYITLNEVGFICGTGCILIRNNSKDLNNLFLNYFLADKSSTDWLENNAVGATMKNLSGGILKKLPLSIPPINTQKRIADILSAYDDLIENNLKRIKLLEQAAQNIYKEWFVNLRFPGYENAVLNTETRLPKGWELKRSDEVFKINIGKTPPRKEPEWFSFEKGYKWVSISDMNKSIVFIQKTKERITDEGVNKFNVKIVPKGTVLLSFKLTIGAVVIATEDMVTNEAIAHFNIDEATSLSTEYTYCFLNCFPYKILGSTSSIGQALNSKIVKSIPVLVPQLDLVNLFTKNVNPIFKQLENLVTQNQKLKASRDILLPRLMNRTIEV